MVTPYRLAGPLGLRRAGARLRINAQLVDTHTDFSLWSDRYDREMKDVFEVQDDIARSIAAYVLHAWSASERVRRSA